jgi:hypothetical protein
MKTLIASACLALALAAGVAAAPASAHDDHAGGRSWDHGRDGGNGPDWSNGDGWNGGPPPWLGYNNPAWPHGPNGCLGVQRKDSRWDDCNGWREGKWHDGGKRKFVPYGGIVKQLYAAGYRHVFDIDRDGNRYEVRALDRYGRKVILIFNARNGDFIKKRYL